MKITFIGADHEVTGSCTLIECNGVRGIVDCGMEQGRDIFENQTLPVNAAEIDFVLLTHAHVDHSGNIPLLYKNGFRGGIWATEATCNLCNIMLRDCAHIQEMEAEYKNRKGKRAGRPYYQPVYDMDDALGSLNHFIPCRYGQIVEVAPGVRARMTDVGHLLGSAAIEVFLTEGDQTRTIVFSGDVGNVNQPLLRDPQPVAAADFLVIESTYGDRLHSAERPDYLTSLAGMIQRAFDRGGNVIIPSFAVGRTQELLYFIREIKQRGLVRNHPDFPVWVDSPLAVEATSIFQMVDHDYLDEEAVAYLRAGINPLRFPGLHVSQSVEDSKAINMDRKSKVVISASGMCEAGRIRHHLKHNLWDARNLILFVGYQAAGTLGRILYDGAEKVKLFGEEIAVRAEIAVLPGVSGHADRDGLVNWIGGFTQMPRQVFVNHGEDTVTDAFAAWLHSQFGLRADAPYSGAVYDLLEERFVAFPQGKPVEKKAQTQTSKSPAYARLLSALESLVQLVSRCEGWANRDLTKFADQIEALVEKWR